MDSRTGAMTYYTSSGGEYNSKAAEDAVGGNPIIKQGRLLPTQPILYNLFKQNTWVVPAVADNGKFQTLALLQAAGGHVVVGATGASSPAQDAFASYSAFLGDNSTGGTSPKISGTIDRFAYANGRAWFTLRGKRGIYTIVDPTSPDVLLARSGDVVTFATTSDEGGGKLVRGFTDTTLGR
jgi:hypothetical protein